MLGNRGEGESSLHYKISFLLRPPCLSSRGGRDHLFIENRISSFFVIYFSEDVFSFFFCCRLYGIVVVRRAVSWAEPGPGRLLSLRNEVLGKRWATLSRTLAQPTWPLLICAGDGSALLNFSTERSFRFQPGSPDECSPLGIVTCWTIPFCTQVASY